MVKGMRHIVTIQKAGMMTMRVARQWLLTAAALAMATASLAAQTDEMRIPFSDPARPGRVEVSILHGKVTIEGYDGREVLVTSTSSSPGRTRRSSRAERDGLRRIGTSTSSLEAEEQNNVLRLKGGALQGATDLHVRVPVNSAVKVKCVNCGDLTVSNVNGGLELENLNGTIQATDVAGAVSAHALNNKVLVKMRRVEPGKALAFTSMNGDVDVTLPADTKADIVVDNMNGETFTDFEMQLQSSREMNKVDNRSRGGSFRARVSTSMRAQLNGGGATIQFKNVNGDILIRKGQ